MTRIRLLGITLASFVAAGAARAQSGPAARPDLSAAKKDLSAAVRAQESFYSDKGTYTINLADLKMTPAPGVTIKLIEASNRGWSGSATLSGADGVSCVVFVGRTATPPKTAKGVPATDEGAPVCDGLTTAAAPASKK